MAGRPAESRCGLTTRLRSWPRASLASLIFLIGDRSLPSRGSPFDLGVNTGGGSELLFRRYVEGLGGSCGTACLEKALESRPAMDPCLGAVLSVLFVREYGEGFSSSNSSLMAACLVEKLYWLTNSERVKEAKEKKYHRSRVSLAKSTNHAGQLAWTHQQTSVSAHYSEDEL